MWFRRRLNMCCKNVKASRSLLAVSDCTLDESFPPALCCKRVIRLSVCRPQQRNIGQVCGTALRQSILVGIAFSRVSPDPLVRQGPVSQTNDMASPVWLYTAKKKDILICQPLSDMCPTKYNGPMKAQGMIQTFLPDMCTVDFIGTRKRQGCEALC